MELDIPSIIRETLLKRAREHESQYFMPEPGVHHPSALWHCMRKQYLDALAARTLGSPDELNGYAALGSLIHEALADVLAEWVKNNGGVEVESEVPLRIVVPSAGIIFAAYADDIILLRRDGSRMILEIKTVNRIPDEPRKEHIAQLNVYLHAYPTATGILLYVSRKTFEMHAFEVRRDEGLFEATVARAGEVERALRDGRVPPPEAAEYPDRSWECRYCRWARICGELRTGAPLGEKEFRRLVDAPDEERDDVRYARDLVRKARQRAPEAVPVTSDAHLMWDTELGRSTC